MADEHKTANQDNDANNNTNDTKITFTDEQQAKVQELIDTAVGRVAAKVRNEEAAKLTSLQSDLAAAKEAAKSARTTQQRTDANDDVAALKAKIDEMKSASETLTTEVNRWKGEAQSKAREAETARTETQGVRQEVAMATAASKLPFVDTEVVLALTRGQVHQDADGKFIVLREDGQPRLNAAMEPMTLEEFYNDFASRRPYLVRGDVRTGTGASESQKSAFTGNRSFEVTQIFGPKSDSRLANELAKTNISEYRRLKDIAKKQGLIA